MDPVTMVVIPGLIGGACYAWLLARLHRRSGDRLAGERTGAVSTDVINISRIHVAGVGGLGLVAMALVVAYQVPSVGRPFAIGLVFGAILGIAMIVVRRARPLRSSAAQSGANTTLAIDATPRTEKRS